MFLLFLFPRERRKHISSLCGFEGERNQNISLVFQGENSRRESFHLERKQRKTYVFNILIVTVSG